MNKPAEALRCNDSVDDHLAAATEASLADLAAASPGAAATPEEDPDEDGLSYDEGLLGLKDAYDRLHTDATAQEKELKQAQADNAALERKLAALRAELVQEAARVHAPERRRLPDERRSVTHKFEIYATKDNVPLTYKGYLTMGFYVDGNLGEVFFKIDKGGSEVSGLCDAWAIGTSMLLQYGITFERIATKHRGAKFEPSGFTSNKQEALRTCSSPIDYVVRYVEAHLAQRALEVDHA